MSMVAKKEYTYIFINDIVMNSPLFCNGFPKKSALYQKDLKMFI